MRTTTLALVVLLATVLAAQPSSATEAPDLIRLKDGGMLRGTIIELVPGETVDVLLVGGERRKLDMAVVEYAGPSDSAPAPVAARPPPPPLSDSDAALPRIRVDSADPQLQLHLRVGTSTVLLLGGGHHGRAAAGLAVNWGDLCTSLPCEIFLPPGRYTNLGLSAPLDPIVEVAPIDITPTTQRLVATYDAHARTRGPLGIVAAALTVAGVVLFVHGASSQRDEIGADMRIHHHGADTIFPGLVLFGLGGVTGLVAVAIPPSATLVPE